MKLVYQSTALKKLVGKTVKKLDGEEVITINYIQKAQQIAARERAIASAEMGFEILFKVVGPLQDLRDKAQTESVEVEIALGMNDPFKAKSIAWSLVKKYSELAGPRFLQSAREAVKLLRDGNSTQEITERMVLAEKAAEEKNWKESMFASRKVYFLVNQRLEELEKARKTRKKENSLRNREERRYENFTRAKSGGAGSKQR